MAKTAEVPREELTGAARQIVKRRTQLLIHRYLYYVRCEPLIDDFTYDMMERELKALVVENPEIAAAVRYAADCPTQTVGTSNLWGYPREVQYLGDSLLAFNERWPFGYIEPSESPEDITLEEQPGFF
jgi:hypothetical protein